MRIDVDRLTLIHPQKTDECKLNGQCYVVFSGKFVSAAIVPREVDFPRWERRGVDVVAAHADGSVSTAFTALKITRENLGSDIPGKHKVYYGERNP